MAAVIASADREGSAKVTGRGLHSGRPGSVTFERCEGPVVVRAGGVELPIAELVVLDTARSTTIGSTDGKIRVATIEHVFAALAGLGLHDGVAVRIEGAEAPLADGGARAYADAAVRLGVEPSKSRLRIVREGVVVVGTSRYELTPADAATSGRVEVEVEVDFDDERLARTARWSGDSSDFRLRIAVARTFGFEREVEDLLARGLASHVTPESVVVIGEAGVLSSGAPFEADEPARHKLLDLLGDLYVHGGPPCGRVRATRPGHAMTHEAMRLARAMGLVTVER